MRIEVLVRAVALVRDGDPVVPVGVWVDGGLRLVRFEFWERGGEASVNVSWLLGAGSVQINLTGTGGFLGLSRRLPPLNSLELDQSTGVACWFCARA